jgi:hypothetical protein
MDDDTPTKGSPVFLTTSIAIPSLHDILYDDLSLEEKGLSKEAFDYAMKGYDKLVTEDKVSNATYITICDMTQSSKHKRLYVVDLNTKEVVINTWVAHGRNSVYVTQFTYNGENGYSLKLKGLEPGYNDKAFDRAIVIHGADYVTSDRTATYMGRSYGCPAVSTEESEALINTIKNGTCLFIYYPDKKYIKGSKILND